MAYLCVCTRIVRQSGGNSATLSVVPPTPAHPSLCAKLARASGGSIHDPLKPVNIPAQLLSGRTSAPPRGADPPTAFGSLPCSVVRQSPDGQSGRQWKKAQTSGLNTSQLRQPCLGQRWAGRSLITKRTGNGFRRLSTRVRAPVQRAPASASGAWETSGGQVREAQCSEPDPEEDPDVVVSDVGPKVHAGNAGGDHRPEGRDQIADMVADAERK